MKTLLITLMFITTLTSYSQNKVLLEFAEDIETYATKEFDQSVTNPEGDLYLFGQENNITGEYTFKVSIGLKNKVTSVFVKERKGGNISMQNIVKDAVMEFKFETFKVPKGKYYNVIYTFKF